MLHEDVYFGIFASMFDTQFRVGSTEDGDRFAWEYAPYTLFAKCNERLPFGAHAWAKFKDSRAFWAEHKSF